MRYFYLLIVGVGLLGSQVVYGRPLVKAPTLIVKRKVKVPSPQRLQRITFEDDTITGGRDTGDGGIITGRLKLPMKSMLTIRENFIPELIKSAEWL